MRSIVLGLDGVTFNLLNPLLDKGKLPNFKKLIEKGVYGDMLNSVYLASPPAWTTITTGHNPGQHGIYDFLSIEKDHSFKLNFSNEKKIKPFWEFVDKKSIIVNLPLTYPPKHDNDNLTVVSGMLTPGLDSEFTYPLPLKQEILSEIKDYKITLDWELYANNKKELIIDLKKMIDSRLKLFDYLMENKKWDLFFGVIIATDRLQHIFWDEENILEIYSMLDDYIGKLMKKVEEENLNLFVVSDHGFGEVDELFYLNTWLEQNGYLVAKEDAASQGFLRKIGVNREFVAKFLKGLGVDTESLRMKLPDKIKNMVPMGEKSVFRNIDWEKTRAFFYGFGNLYLNKKERFDDGIVENVEGLKKELIEKLSECRAIKKVHDSGDVFSGKVFSEAPDLVVELKDRFAFAKSLGSNVYSESKDMKADHLPKGVFFAYGKGIKENYKKDMGILDFAPTLSWVMDRKEGEFEGQIAFDILKGSRFEMMRRKRSEKDFIKNALGSMDLRI